MSVSSNVRKLREAAGQTIEDVSSGARIQLNVMNGIEMGRVVRPDQVEAIARYFGVSVDELEGKDA